MSVKIRKRNGRQQKFRRSKIMSSLQKAGLESKKAKVISQMVEVSDGMTAGEIKYSVYNLLKKIDPKVAERYWTTRGFKASEEVLEVDGNAIISKETMHDLGLHVGEPIDIFNGEKFETVRAYEISYDSILPGNIYISQNDMLDIGIHPGSRIAVRKHRAAA
jgi:hypothetical protein